MPTDIDPVLEMALHERALNTGSTSGVGLAQGVTFGGLGGNANNAWSYIVGQCTYYVASALSWIPSGLGNAKDWLANAKAKGFQTTNVPTVGSAVVYGAGHGYSGYGHVAKVESVNANGTFVVSEQNYTAPGVTDFRTSTLADVEGFILPPNGAPGSGTTSNAQLTSAAVPTGNPFTDWLEEHVMNALGIPDLHTLLFRFALITMGLLIALIGIYYLANGPKLTEDITVAGAKVAPLAA